MRSIKSCLPAIVVTLIIVPFNLGAGEKTDAPVVFLGKTLTKHLHHEDPHTIRDLFIEDVPGTKSYWLGPWVQKVAVSGIDRFYIIKGHNRFYVNATFLGDSRFQFYLRSTGIHDFYGSFEGKPSDRFKIPAEDGADQPATAVESKSKGEEKPKPESEERVILERSRILGDSAHPGDAHDVYAISRKMFDEQLTLDLRKDTITLPMEKAVQSCYAHLKRFYAQRNIKDQFVVWGVELKHMPGTKRGAYQGKFYYFIEIQLFGESGRPFFCRRSVLLDGTVVPPVREYE